eukprot:TRINITY_DN5824_c0_g1_i1.p1 TRINITY_DN5824_c0_g1~~TRINITY_DN5824_c0_g1_i1.p1  ORF type:complete len:225 (+),score=45.44 TRINITY_DN5824_c0_g1_i1:78-752(+)
MRITEELLLSAVKASPNQTASQAVAKATHVRLNGKQIERIENLERCSNMQVLYLYDNRIVQVENLHTAAHLTHLYLQNNRIAELSNFATLRRLQKLYLDGNCINHLSGLEALQSLEELHISRQQIPTETVFSIDETCMMGLSSSLVILTISGNHLVDPLPLRHLRALQKLDASDNRIHDIEVWSHSCLSTNRVFALFPIQLKHARIRFTFFCCNLCKNITVQNG